MWKETSYSGKRLLASCVDKQSRFNTLFLCGNDAEDGS